MKFDFRWFTHFLTCIGLYALIGFAIYTTGTLWALLALIFTPSLETKTSDSKDDKKEPR